LLCPEGAAAAGPQARAHAGAPAGRRKGAFIGGAADAARLLGALPQRPSERLPPSFPRFAQCSRFPAKPPTPVAPPVSPTGRVSARRSAARKPKPRSS